jgi:concanavalin A-like lectin/glucanase superfamily protein
MFMRAQRWLLGCLLALTSTALAQTIFFKADHLYLGRTGPIVAVSSDAVTAAGTKPAGIPVLNTSHPLASNLTAFWLMNEGQGTLIRNVINPGVYDVQLQNLTYQHWATLPESGNIGIFCENFNNTTAGVLTSPLTTTDTFTWHARVNISSIPVSYSTLFSHDYGSGMYIRPYLSDAKLQYYFTYFNDTSWPLGVWMDLVAVLDHGQLTYYRNGAADGGPYGQGSMDVTNMFNDSGGERLHGYVDFQRIWVGRALTAAEVADAVANPYAVFLP